MRPFFFYLPAFLQGLSLRAFFDLPVSVHRYVGGETITNDEGYELEPQFQSFLRYMKVTNLSIITPDDIQITRDEALSGAIALQQGDDSDAVETRDIHLGRVKARLYNPINTLPGRKPLLVYFHGGGWVFGNIETHHNIAKRIAGRSGVMVISVEYRLAPENKFPAAVNDAVETFQYLATRSHHIGVRHRHIAIGGDSAGANIAAAASHILCNKYDTCPKFQLLLYPVAAGTMITPSRKQFSQGFFLSKADMEWFAQQYCAPSYCDDPYVNLLALPVPSKFPSTYIAVAGFDPLRDEGLMLADHLRRSNVTVTTRVHHSFIHGFATFASVMPQCAAALDEASDVLAETMDQVITIEEF